MIRIPEYSKVFSGILNELVNLNVIENCSFTYDFEKYNFQTLDDCVEYLILNRAKPIMETYRTGKLLAIACSTPTYRNINF